MDKIIIKKESELKGWVIKNYQKLGYDKILRKDIGECPDLIMMKEGREVRVELETLASNFLLHKHSINDVDVIICVKKDIELGKQIIEIDELIFEGNPNMKVTLSIDAEVYNAFQKHCEENAIMLSKRIELFMKELLNIKKKKEVSEK